MPKKNGSYNEVDLQKALEDIRNKEMSKKAAANYFGIPRATLIFRLSEKFKKVRPGPSTILSNEEEDTIEEWIRNSQKKGFPKRKEDVLHAVKEFLSNDEREHPFGPNNMPGNGWFRAFLKRHPSITLRTPDPVTAASATVGANDIQNWFVSIENYLKENEFLDILNDSTRIFNGDETNFMLCPKTKVVLAAKGAKNIYEVDKGMAKANLTVMFSFAASGALVPPMVIYPYKRIHEDIRQSLPKEWGLAISDNGWMTKEVFYEYIAKVFHPYLVSIGTKFPILFFVDGHATHQTLEVSKLCVKLGIVLIALYPNATRILQPADVSAFKPLKNGWNKKVLEWRRHHPRELLTKQKFAPLLAEVIEDSIRTETIQHGFRVCGIFPWDKQAIDYSKCLGKSSGSTTEGFNNKKDSLMSSEKFEELLGVQILQEFSNAINIETLNWPEEKKILYKMFLEFNPDFVPRSSTSIFDSDINIPILCNTTNEILDIEGINEFLFVDSEINIEEYVDNVGQENLCESLTKYTTPLKVCPTIDEFLDWPETPRRQGVKPIKPKKPFVITDQLWITAEQIKKEKKKMELKVKEENKTKRLEKQNKRVKEKSQKLNTKLNKKLKNNKTLQPNRVNSKNSTSRPNVPELMEVDDPVLQQFDQPSSNTVTSLNHFDLIQDDDNQISIKLDVMFSNTVNNATLNELSKLIENPGSLDAAKSLHSPSHVRNIFKEPECAYEIGENRIAVGSICYKCTFSLRKNIGIRCNQCTREFHVTCIQKMKLPYLPKFLCGNCNCASGA